MYVRASFFSNSNNKFMANEIIKYDFRRDFG